MPVEKSKRNELIMRLWNEGKSNQEILTSLKGVSTKTEGLSNWNSLGEISRAYFR